MRLVTTAEVVLASSHVVWDFAFLSATLHCYVIPTKYAYCTQNAQMKD
jgi:hypothetical protein